MEGGECWLELSTNSDEENQILDHKCPFNLPKFPQLQLTAMCPDNVEQCATINFCNTESEATVKTPIHSPHHALHRTTLHTMCYSTAPLSTSCLYATHDIASDTPQLHPP
ncbi:hypothetical protein Pcinc_011443 [Petrolisthes cinctipes]|uniref:Uncharacterized protein n=1 Tax=Petrolisthes cinctipes TaxID=88211 RepID=A0AAE1G0U2_PETCI|nr:hypothetical protein Pcinc_011443 [Petrolisthes cinctipes]